MSRPAISERRPVATLHAELSGALVAPGQGAPADTVSSDTTAVAARIRSLIAHEDSGDVCAASRRLGVAVRDLVRLEETLATLDAGGDTGCADSLLSAVVVRYGVSGVWLLTGCSDSEVRELRPCVCDRLARVLLASAQRVVDEYQGAALSRH